MRLAAYPIVIRVEDEVIVLRPTLRAALRLERRHGFLAVLEALAEGSLTMIAAVIRENADHPTSVPAFLDTMAASGVCQVDALAALVMAHVLSLAGVDPEDKAAPQASTGERVPYGEFFERLYRVGTGHLGWTPETTWSASPAEIVQAYRGRQELLRAIFGGDPDEPNSTGPDTTRDEKGIAAIKAMALGGRVTAA